MQKQEKYALLGFPVQHSLSPQMQMAAFNKSKIKASYELIEVTSENLANTFLKLRQTHKGWNCTLPHKEASYKLVDRCDESAKITGRVNTVINNNGILTGYSTDGYGMQMSIKKSFGIFIKDTHFVFLGAGGASHSVALHFSAQGAKRIDIINRSLDKAQKTSQEITNLNCQSDAYTTTQNIKPILEKAQIIIQTTSLGLKDDDPCPINEKDMPQNKIVVDMIYKKTKFLQLAQANNCQITNGFGMLLYQGVKAWEIWTNQSAPVEVMKQALIQAN